LGESSDMKNMGERFPFLSKNY
jgi:hypothetical protein